MVYYTAHLRNFYSNSKYLNNYNIFEWRTGVDKTDDKREKLTTHWGLNHLSVI